MLTEQYKDMLKALFSIRQSLGMIDKSIHRLERLYYEMDGQLRDMSDLARTTANANVDLQLEIIRRDENLPGFEERDEAFNPLTLTYDLPVICVARLAICTKARDIPMVVSSLNVGKHRLKT